MRLKELREEKKLSQIEVANAIKTSQRNISRWEKEQNEPTSTFVIQLANFFQCSTDYLLGRSDDFGNVTVQQKSPSSLTPEEQNLLNDFRSLPRQERSQAAEYVHFLADRRGSHNKNA